MSFLKKLFVPRKDVSVASFWEWFMDNEQSFYRTVKNQDNVDKNFMGKLFPQLQSLNPKFYCLTGMYDKQTVELIVTTESDIKSFVFAEELISAAPVLEGWRFTALTPPTGFHDANIDMDGYRFDASKIRFSVNENADYPDEIDLVLVHSDFTETNGNVITSGTLIYLENALGELNRALLIDRIEIKGPSDSNQPLIPIEKLGDFLRWKEKEFVEKYDGLHYPLERENYTVLEAKDKSGRPMIAVVNQDLLNWDAKASYPWMMVIDTRYAKGNNGMPGAETADLLNRFEDELTLALGANGYLNLGRRTYNDVRTIYFACKEFRTVSKNVHQLIGKYGPTINASYDIYKDKYWMTMNQYKTH